MKIMFIIFCIFFLSLNTIADPSTFDQIFNQIRFRGNNDPAITLVVNSISVSPNHNKSGLTYVFIQGTANSGVYEHGKAIYYYNPQDPIIRDEAKIFIAQLMSARDNQRPIRLIAKLIPNDPNNKEYNYEVLGGVVD